MTTYFVSRHPGAVAWAQEEGVAVDKQITHFDPTIIREHDVVIGSLPVHMVADICERGGDYYHLSMELESEMRGKELSADDMRACHARLEAFCVLRVMK